MMYNYMACLKAQILKTSEKVYSSHREAKNYNIE